MIKRYCDICKKEMTDKNTPRGGPTRARVSSQSVIAGVTTTIEVLVSPHTDICKHCILDTLYTLDDRITTDRLKPLPNWAKFIARDLNGELWVYNSEPIWRGTYYSNRDSRDLGPGDENTSDNIGRRVDIGYDLSGITLLPAPGNCYEFCFLNNRIFACRPVCKGYRGLYFNEEEMPKEVKKEVWVEGYGRIGFL